MDESSEPTALRKAGSLASYLGFAGFLKPSQSAMSGRW
jgi:hypothetical protein